MATERIPRLPRRTRRLHAAVYLLVLVLLFTGWWLVLGREGEPSPLARLTGVGDTRIHIWVGRALGLVVVAAIVVGWRGVLTFLRESFRIDRGDARWWRRWPAAILTGRFARHEGDFDPGQRIANIVIVGCLLVLTATGIALTFLHGGPTFAWLAKIHEWTTFILTPVLVGHILVAVGILPGYRGAWRAMHARRGVREDTARRLWPGWTERALGTRSTEATSVPPPDEPADAGTSTRGFRPMR